MKKIIATDEQIEQMKKMFVDELKGLREISKLFGWSTSAISRILKENGVYIKGSGAKYLGGKKVSDKKYYTNPDNKEKLQNKRNRYVENNRERLREYHKEWREKNKESHRKTKREYEKKRKSIDPLYKLTNYFRTAIYQVLKENNVTKNGHYFDILNYTPTDLMNHLENLFTEGMTWDNYGEWHVDHIKPITSFNIKEIGDSEFMLCWSLSNLQPLWGIENIRKSNKMVC